MPKNQKKITTKLEQVFGIPFAQLIEENVADGTSRYGVQRRLLELIVEKGLVNKAIEVFPNTTVDQWNPSKWKLDKYRAVSKESNGAFRPSSVWNAINDEINSGSITKFKFSVSNKGRKAAGALPPKPTISAKIKCSACGASYIYNGVESVDHIGLRVHSCPKCGKFGKGIATINVGNKEMNKAVIRVDGVRQETFVNSPEDLTPLVEDKETTIS